MGLAIGNRDFLRGDPKWWARESVPAQFEWEESLPQEWPTGWRRQRLQPGLASLLIPGAWSLAALCAFWLPLFIGDLGPNQQMVLIVLLGAHFLLLIAPLVFDASRVEHGDVAKAVTWVIRQPFVLAQIALSILGVAMMGAGDLGLVALPFFLAAIVLWWVMIRAIANAMAWPAGRWLFPIAHVDIGLESLPEGWRMVSRRFGRRPLADADLGGGWRLVLYGLSHAGTDFVALWMAHPCGRLVDPFTTPQLIGKPADQAFHRRALRGLAQPPVNPIKGDWPASMGEEE